MMHSPKHLTSISDTSGELITQWLQQAQAIHDAGNWLVSSHESAQRPMLATLFFEPSTRTQLSFYTAARRLGIDVMSPEMNNTSIVKGETVLDTAKTLKAMGVRCVVVRHQSNNIPQFLSQELAGEVSVINAGDGTNEHPTQTLADLLTIQQTFGKFSGLKVAIVGDACHSRVARSLVNGLLKVGVEDIAVVVPEFLKINEPSIYDDYYASTLEAALDAADVVVALRIQRERIKSLSMNEAAYQKNYGITQARMVLPKETAIFLHPGPINRNIEASSEVVDGRQSRVLQQVENGVLVRMAVLQSLLTP